MTDGPDIPFEDTWKDKDLKHCLRYGHVWRYEKQMGEQFRVCVECGAIQFNYGGVWSE